MAYVAQHGIWPLDNIKLWLIGPFRRCIVALLSVLLKKSGIRCTMHLVLGEHYSVVILSFDVTVVSPSYI